MKIKYIEKKLGPSKLAVIDQANAILAEYKRDGLELTLRQLYYQFVSRDLIANTQREYKNLGNVINDGRLCGLIDWEAIIDRTRNLQSLAHWESPRAIVDACADQYRVDKWSDQDKRVEVWIEKDALVGVIEKVCEAYDVPYFSCRGYTSQSELWAAGQRMTGYIEDGQSPVILHFGDHDPSGIDMSRDIQDRLDLFAGPGNVEVKRIALNTDQIEKYNPPPNPAKVNDPRAGEYIKRFGHESWELDALNPRVISDLIKRNIVKHLDAKKYKARIEEENEAKSRIQDAAEAL